MINLTEHFNLKKPSEEEFYNVEDQNGNMDLIDEALHDCDERITSIQEEIKGVMTKEEFENFNKTMYVTLTAAGWTGNEAPYEQTIIAEGATATMEPLLVSALEDGASPEEQKAYIKAYGLICSGTGALGNGTATFKVYKKPAVDITIGLRGVM